MPKNVNDGKEHLSPSFVTGAIALAFLVVGYQTALFIHRASAMRILAAASVPDTVFVEAAAGMSPSSDHEAGRRAYAVVERRSGHIPEKAAPVVDALSPRRCESFGFDPNTVSVEDLCRLGFSRKQALSIAHYRDKGGRFRRKEDFARSFVVSDSVYARLEKYIDIPLLDINSADSAAFDCLPGIGGHFAAKMVEYRRALGGYSYAEQLMDIYNFDSGKFDRLKDLISVGASAPFRLWSMPEDSLCQHPYVSRSAARAIILYRDNNPRSLWTVKGLADAGILDSVTASKLSRCRIAVP